ncbi:hypothetical protein [Adhaeribacter rhizoryzae]|uniref:Uncharacterized protein n=1 Tax=Adhaeribacter rhizoryzae TaxID=2607907 RepID=A0A5M6DK40_9BACT|nr:hypothetical protein [Adhaeribacter rhizoryzae]KAA5547914.1 hypothetical protein F0145_08225 [Adhaeribacter rhizoryzae]
MNKKVLLVRILQLVFFAAVGFANWYKAGNSNDSFYQIVMAVCAVGFVAVLFTLFYSGRKNKV